jgi:hypothetical protein
MPTTKNVGKDPQIWHHSDDAPGWIKPFNLEFFFGLGTFREHA